MKCRMTTPITTPLAPPRVISHGGLLIVGLSERYHGSNAGMSMQWERFIPYVGHVQNQVGLATYGVIRNTDEAGTIDYLTGVEVSAFPSEPKDLVRLAIPPQQYAVFWHPGSVSAVQHTWQAIWQHALADATLRSANGPSFERYDQRFDSRTGQGGLEIWVAVTRG
jgi:AraC family transcriptional regulator